MGLGRIVVLQFKCFMHVIDIFENFEEKRWHIYTSYSSDFYIILSNFWIQQIVMVLKLGTIQNHGNKAIYQPMKN